MTWDWGHVLTLGIAVIGATWALRSKLGDIEHALNSHIQHANDQNRDLERRIVSLEDYRNGLEDYRNGHR